MEGADKNEGDIREISVQIGTVTGIVNKVKETVVNSRLWKSCCGRKRTYQQAFENEQDVGVIDDKSTTTFQNVINQKPGVLSQGALFKEPFAREPIFDRVSIGERISLLSNRDRGFTSIEPARQSVQSRINSYLPDAKLGLERPSLTQSNQISEQSGSQFQHLTSQDEIDQLIIAKEEEVRQLKEMRRQSVTPSIANSSANGIRSNKRGQLSPFQPSASPFVERKLVKAPVNISAIENVNNTTTISMPSIFKQNDTWQVKGNFDNSVFAGEQVSFQAINSTKQLLNNSTSTGQANATTNETIIEMDFPPTEVLEDLGIPVLTDDQLIDVVRQTNAEHENNQIKIAGSGTGKAAIELYIEAKDLKDIIYSSKNVPIGFSKTYVNTLMAQLRQGRKDTILLANEQLSWLKSEWDELITTLLQEINQCQDAIPKIVIACMLNLDDSIEDPVILAKSIKVLVLEGENLIIFKFQVGENDLVELEDEDETSLWEDISIELHDQYTQSLINHPLFDSSKRPTLITKVVQLPESLDQIENLNLIFLYLVRNICKQQPIKGTWEDLERLLIEGNYNDYFRYVVCHELLSLKA